MLRYILGITTVTAIVGVSIYGFKKSRDKKKQEEESISVAEAREEVRRHREAKEQEAPKDYSTDEGEYEVDADVELAKEFDKHIEEHREALHDRQSERIRKSYNQQEKYTNMKIDPDDLTDIEESIEEDYLNMREEIAEEVKEVRHDPSSMDARRQFIQMELAEWNNAFEDDMYETMCRLFEFPFEPKNDGDYDLKTAIIDYRSKFFGFNSKWTKEVTYADVILHYARSATYNCDESVKYWVEYFMEFNDLNSYVSDEELAETIEDLNHHMYVNKDMGTFGLFGLTSEHMNNAIKIASRNIDKSVTYEIEFNEFLKSCV